MQGVKGSSREAGPVQGISDLIRVGRSQKGLSIRQVADRSGVGRSTISRWELGASEPNGSELQAVLRVVEPSSPQLADALCLSPLAAPSTRSFRGDLLRALRTWRGWTLERAAASVGVTKATFSRWETGDRTPTEDVVMLICTAMGASELQRQSLFSGSATTHGDVFEQAGATLRCLQQEIRDANARSLDLEFLGLDAQLRTVSKDYERASNLLAQTRAAYVTWLGWWYRDKEAYLWAARSFEDGIAYLDPGSFCRFHRAQRIYIAEYLNDERRAAALFRGVFNRVDRRKAQGLLVRELAGYLVNAGHDQEAMTALKVARDSQPTDESESIHQMCCDVIEADVWLRRHQPERALSMLPSTPAKDGFIQVSISTTRAASLRAMRLHGLAEDVLRDQVRQFEKRGLNHFAETVRKQVSFASVKA